LTRTRYALVNLTDLSRFDEGTEVTPAQLFEAGMIRKATDLVKVLSDGELTVKLTVKAHKFSKAAAEKISAAGGTTEVISG
jgi:large subunit ribosomal protein L15